KQFLDAPDMIGQPRFHRGSDSETRMCAAEIIKREIQGDGSFQVRKTHTKLVNSFRGRWGFGCRLLALLTRARMFCRPSSEIAYVWLILRLWPKCDRTFCYHHKPAQFQIGIFHLISRCTQLRQNLGKKSSQNGAKMRYRGVQESSNQQ